MGNITDYVAEKGGDICHWYVGTTNTVKTVEKEHKLAGDATKHFKYWTCASKQQADKIEQKLRADGFKGSPRETRYNSKHIYVFYDENMKYE